MNFFSRYKKLFFILLFLAVVFILGWLLWQSFFKASPELPPVTTTPTSSITGLPLVGEGGALIDGTVGGSGLPGESDEPIGTDLGEADRNKASKTAIGGKTTITNLTNSPALKPVATADGHIQYYDKDDNRFYRVDEDGEITLLSDKSFYQVDNVVWAPDRNQAIIEYPDNSKVLYNFATEKQVTLPAHWKDFSFSPSSDQIISKSIGLDPDNRWLMVSQGDGSQSVALEPIGTKDSTVYPSWSPNNQIVAAYTRGVDFDRQEVFFVGLNGENFKSTIIEGRGLEFQWSTKGDRLLYSVYNSRDNYKPRLWIVDADSDSIGQNRRSFDIETWSHKCTFATNSEIYCAVPVNLEKGAGLYPELADETEDNLYKIDLRTGTQKLIAIPQDAYNISEIVVPAGQDYLYFTDRQDDSIYQVKLK